ncbi:MAG: nitrous oxide reductase accessory protein NosL [Bacteroidetes bacterium]|nr:nitrous oxide reductase accessory protein NosL [Bacteroidota bacterium]
MKLLLRLVTLVLLMASCSTEPEPLIYGKDQCEFCKMTLMDNHFGAELVTHTGKVHKFDDIRCLLDFYHQGENPHEQYAHRLVVDYNHPGQLISALDAYYIKADTIRAPMNSKLAAFSTEEDMRAFRKRWSGIYMAWGEVVAQFK